MSGLRYTFISTQLVFYFEEGSQGDVHVNLRVDTYEVAQINKYEQLEKTLIPSTLLH